MPIYEYLCADCKDEFEELVSSSGADQVACPQCGGQTVTRLLSSFARPRVAAGGGGCCGGSCGCC